jgi:hypothetical protein
MKRGDFRESSNASFSTSWVNELVNSNSILEEVWRIKDQLAAESGYDVNRFFENLRTWAAEHPHRGRMVHSAGELRQLAAKKERERDKQSTLGLSEGDRRKGDMQGPDAFTPLGD